MEMDDRKIYILKAIIHDYITCGEPVGSRTIAKKYDLGISSATIRNEMSDLEDMGYLEQLHTSSGRKPSDKGYRFYVDDLMKISALTSEEEAIIRNSLLDIAFEEIDKVLIEATEILSNLTNLTSVVKAPSLKTSSMRYLQLAPIDNNSILFTIVTNSGVIKNKVIKVEKSIDSSLILQINNALNFKLRNISFEDMSLEFLERLKQDLMQNEEIFNAIIPMLYETLINEDNSKVFIKGSTNIFNYQEYNNIDKAKDFLNFVNNVDYVKKLLDTDAKQGLSVKIGEENFLDSAKECSIITATYSYNGNPIGTIGVIGPTRIPYSKVIAVVDKLVKELNYNIQKLYKGF